jgi:tRNA threonylcarbamoyladenosine biosynthesis protein TsaE
VIEWKTASAEETMALGERLGKLSQAGWVIGLSGDLGAGKTTFVKGFARGLGCDPAGVTSPTFTFLHVYRGRIPVYHVDLYRLETARQASDLGIDEYLGGDGVALVEWFENVPGWLPQTRLELFLEVTGEDTRKIRVDAKGEGFGKILEEAASWG